MGARVHPKFRREPTPAFGSVVDRLVAWGATSPETARSLGDRLSLGERVVLDANLRWQVVRVTPAGLYWVDEARRTAREHTQVRAAAIVVLVIVVLLVVLELSL